MNSGLGNKKLFQFLSQLRNLDYWSICGKETCSCGRSWNQMSTFFSLQNWGQEMDEIVARNKARPVRDIERYDRLLRLHSEIFCFALKHKTLEPFHLVIHSSCLRPNERCSLGSSKIVACLKTQNTDCQRMLIFPWGRLCAINFDLFMADKLLAKKPRILQRQCREVVLGQAVLCWFFCPRWHARLCGSNPLGLRLTLSFMSKNSAWRRAYFPLHAAVREHLGTIFVCGRLNSQPIWITEDLWFMMTPQWQGTIRRWWSCCSNSRLFLSCR